VSSRLQLQVNIETLQNEFVDAATKWYELREQEADIQIQILDARDEYHLARLKLKEAKFELEQFDNEENN